MKIVGSGLVSVDNMFLVKKNGVFGQNSEVEGVSPGEKMPCRYIGSHGGGSASNTLCILSKLGFESSVIGVTGKDHGAKLVLDEFADFGVRSDLVAQKEGETRQFAHLIYPNAHAFKSECPICRNEFHRAPSLDERDILAKSDLLERIFNSDIFHVDRANKITLRLVNSAYQKGKIISFDFGYQASLGNYEIASEIIKRTTILKTSKGAERTFLSRMSRSSFHELNPNLLICVTTLGDQGSKVAYKSERGLRSISLQPYHPQPVVDRGGAGDAFHAGLVYGLRNIILQESKAIASESTLTEALKLAQGFGGLACTDYGARGYFLSRLKEGDFESSVMTDFTKLSREEYVGSPGDPDELFAEKRNQLLSRDVCGVCGRRFLGNDASTFYEEKVDSAPWAMSTSFLSGTRSGEFFSRVLGQRLYVVGSGASYSVAVFGALLTNQLTDCIGIATTPYEYISLAKPASSAVLISFGGENRDILSALEKARDLHSSEIHVFTGKNESTLARYAKGTPKAHVHHVSSRVTDSGFVSTTGMLACVSMLVGVLAKSFRFDTLDLSEFFGLQSLSETFLRAKTEVITSFRKVSESLDRDQPTHIVALGSGWAWPAVVDFEARMTEGAVCTTEISELKNYTHGRYLNAYRNKASRFFVIFGLPSDARLVRFLKEKLSRDFPVLVANSQLEPPAGALDLLIRELYVSSEISKKLGLDIAKVIRFPKESRGLFSWGPIYSPAAKIDEFVKDRKAQEARSKYQTKLS